MKECETILNKFASQMYANESTNPTNDSTETMNPSNPATTDHVEEID